MASDTAKDVYRQLESLIRGEEGYFVKMDREESGTYLYVGRHFNVRFNGGTEADHEPVYESILHDTERKVVELFGEYYDDVDWLEPW